MIHALPKNRSQLDRLVALGESATLEYKRSTGELRDAMRTVCAFLNGEGGIVLFGVRPDGRIDGQQALMSPNSPKSQVRPS